jgi:NAD(P)-dependent dehydrogenase (short-subunit alcohol dehydrogenase family)
MRLKDNVAIITGAGQGIGEAYATRFAQEGARVAVADINADKGEAVAANLRKTGADAIFVKVDVSNEDDTRKMAKTVADKWGRIDTLIANAAIFYDIDNTNQSYAYLRKIFDVNYFGVWLSARAVYPYMKKQNKGSIITQSSGAAYMHPYMPHDDELPSFHYSVTKASISALTHFIAGAVGMHGVRCNCISPGPTMTEATKKTVSEDIMNYIINMMMALKRPLDPSDLAGTAVFLASDDSAMITGQVFCVDGGMIMLG